MNIRLKIKRLCADAKLPAYAMIGDAGLDLFASETVILKKGDKAAIPTGIAMEIPDGYVGLIWDKSGLAVKSGLKTLGGVIDSGYRGEVLVGMINLGAADFAFEKGNKIAQMIIQKKESVIVEEAAELSDADRGARGFGSSGK